MGELVLKGDDLVLEIFSDVFGRFSVEMVGAEFSLLLLVSAADVGDVSAVFLFLEFSRSLVWA